MILILYDSADSSKLDIHMKWDPVEREEGPTQSCLRAALCWWKLSRTWTEEIRT
jgi:hypothetical protein